MRGDLFTKENNYFYVFCVNAFLKEKKKTTTIPKRSGLLYPLSLLSLSPSLSLLSLSNRDFVTLNQDR